MNNRIITTAALGLMIVAGVPAAHAGEEQGASVQHHVVTRAVQANPDGAAQNVEVRVLRDNDKESISVIVNGEEVDASRIKIDDGRVIILDDKGQELPMRIFVDPSGDFDPDTWLSDWKSRWTDVEGLEGQMWHVDDDGIGWVMEQHEAPKVMMGVHIDRPSPALLYHLDLEPNSGTIVTGTYEGLPANRAGLHQHDLIVAIDGRSPATPAEIQTVLREREPGDVIELAVYQKGRRRTVMVELAAYDANVMKAATLLGKAVPSPLPMIPGMPLRGLENAQLGAIMDLSIGLGGDDSSRRIFIAPDGGKHTILEAPRVRIAPGSGAGVWSAETPGGASGGDGDRLNTIDDRIRHLEELLERLIKEAG